MKIQSIDGLRDLLYPVFFKAGVKKVVVFGSMARDTETGKSDLDLMIIKETDKRFFDRYEEFDEIYDIIKHKAIDILIYTSEELQNISHRPFIRRILEEGKTIYEH